MRRKNGAFHLSRRRFRGADILLDEASVTATENIMMAATLAPGRTTIMNAACEPHVQDLGALLIKMGATISGLGTNRIEIEGVEKLNGRAIALVLIILKLAVFLRRRRDGRRVDCYGAAGHDDLESDAAGVCASGRQMEHCG